MQKVSNGISTEELMEELDESLVYGGARKISEYEAELLDQIDASYAQQMKLQREIRDLDSQLERTNRTLQQTDKAIEENCSEMTKKKILLARGWQFGIGEEEIILEASSDKELVEKQKNKNNINNQEPKPEITIKTVVSNAISKGITTEQVADVNRNKQNVELELGAESEEKVK